MADVIQDDRPSDYGATGQLFIDGQSKDAISGETIEVFDPATGRSIGKVASAGKDDVDVAVAAARQAFEDGRWTSRTPAERAKIMFRVADLIEAAGDQIATAEVVENGMPMMLARWCVGGAAEAFRYFGGWITKIAGETLSVSLPMDLHCYTLREPIGVAGLIVPWNGPFISAAMKIAPALAAGCTVVLKPSEETPLNTLLLARLLSEAGVPDGVVNVLPGYGHSAGDALVRHPDVDKISFTGSGPVGRRIVEAAAGNFKRVTLELGGKSPVIVLDDADLDQATAGVLAGILTNSGQQCLAGSRLYVQRSIYDRLLERLAGAAQSLKLGSGLDADTQLGPLISQRQIDRVMSYVQSGLAEGARLVTGGQQVGDAGYFMTPTILAETGANTRVMREEIFGPVLSAVPFDDPEEAVRLANDTRYGLAGAVYTRDISKAHKMARRIRSGHLYINCHGIMDHAVPFGGYRESGWGREGGMEGLSAFLQTKSVFALL